MRLILFRHGPAGRRDSSRWPDDNLRPLTSRGESRTRAAAAGLKRLERSVGLILTSPLKRADRTARLIAEALETDRVETLDALAPGGSQPKLIEAVGRHPRAQTIVLVGHEPDLGVLAGLLLFGGAALPLKKAGGCAIEFEGAVRAGAGSLAWFAPPRMLRRLARKVNA